MPPSGDTADAGGRSLLLALLVIGCQPTAVVPVRDGQWVWSPADTIPLRQAERTGPVLAGVWVATVEADSTDTLHGRLALSPTIARADSVAIVIRFESSLNAWWGRVDDQRAAAAIGERLAAVLAIVDRGRVVVAEVQLDYDCPNRLLSRYATVLTRLKGTVLATRRIWVTSLVTHVRDPEYLGRLDGVVEGHILQLFDTGDPATSTLRDELVARLDRSSVPFRIGVGAFERLTVDGPTDHRRWFDALPAFRGLVGYRGRWVFPAGRTYR